MEIISIQEDKELTYEEAAEELYLFLQNTPATKQNEAHLAQIQTLIEALNYERTNPDSFY